MEKKYKKAFVKYVSPYKKFAALNIISNIFYAIFSTLAFLVFIPLLKVLFSEDIHKSIPRPQWTGIEHAKEYYSQLLNYHWLEYINTHGQKQALTLVIILVISIVFLKNLFNYAALFFMTFLRNGMLRDMRNDMYDKVLSLPIPFFSERKKGDIIARMTSDVNEVKNAAMVVLEVIVREPLTILFTIVTMWIMNYKLTLFVFLFTPVAGYIISAIGKRLKKSSHLVQKENSQFLSLIEESLSGLKIIKGFNAEPLFSKKFKKITQNIYRYTNTMINRQNLAHPLSEFLGILVIVAIVWYGGKLVLDEKSLSPAVFIAFIALAYNVLTPAKAIAKASYAIQKGMASVERIFNILEAKSPLEDKPGALEKKSFDKDIRFENVSFKYELDDVLKDVNFELKKGEMLALVGQSGSGKSTIANLLMRFYDVTGGAIKIDGIDIRDITKKSLRDLMGLVTQDSILFNDTVKNNIALGKPGASMEEIIQAAKIANAHDFIMELPQAYDTNIGDSGNKLSGGQKQRLNIARAILKNPPVMVMDEATSALDTESEKLVQDALDKLMKNRTSIVIAHRLSTIKNADKIIVLHKGRIIEIGNHKELMDKKGTYHNLIMLQSFE